MSSTSSDIIDHIQTGHVECYNVIYSPGERTKTGKRTWHDGLLTYYTINKKLILRDDHGHLVEETFSPPPPVIAGQTQPIKEEGIHLASFPIAVAFQVGQNYTVEIERVKYIHEKTLDSATLRRASRQHRQTKEMTDYYAKVPDILPAILKPFKAQSASPGQKRKESPLTLLDANCTPRRRHNDFDTSTSKSPSTNTPLKSIRTPPGRCRMTGLSKTPKRG